MKQETVSGSGISWAICKSAPCSRQTTIAAPHHSVFLQAGCPSCCPTNSVNALKAKKIISCENRFGFQRLDISILSASVSKCYVEFPARETLGIIELVFTACRSLLLLSNSVKTQWEYQLEKITSSLAFLSVD